MSTESFNKFMTMSKVSVLDKMTKTMITLLCMYMKRKKMNDIFISPKYALHKIYNKIYSKKKLITHIKGRVGMN